MNSTIRRSKQSLKNIYISSPLNFTMPKKRTRKSSSARKTERKPITKVEDLEHTLVSNLVELQKINTDMAEKFDKLSKEISSLLALFEVTAHNFAKNAPIGEYEKDKEFLNKMDTLLDQNKTLAKGLTLMEERLRERVYGGTNREEERREDVFQQSISPGKKPLPRF